jgi:hypothetical protein
MPSIVCSIASYFWGLIILFTGFFLMGCGYQFRATGEPLGTKIESIAIPLIESTSSIIGFEAEFTRFIREEFISFGRVSLVSKETAQVVLTGRIHDIKTEPLIFDIQQQVVSGVLTTDEITSRRRLKIRLDMKLTERATGRILWQDKHMEDRASFEVDADPLVTRFNQSRALERIARELARRIFLKTMERF